jgi:hypothetical protein
MIIYIVTSSNTWFDCREPNTSADVLLITLNRDEAFACSRSKVSGFIRSLPGRIDIHECEQYHLEGGGGQADPTLILCDSISLHDDGSMIFSFDCSIHEIDLDDHTGFNVTREYF